MKTVVQTQSVSILLTVSLVSAYVWETMIEAT